MQLLNDKKVSMRGFIALGLALLLVAIAESVVASVIVKERRNMRPIPHSRKPYKQDSQDQYNILLRGGALQPYIQHPGYGIDPDTPEGCIVDQVHLLARHGERFPSRADGEQQKRMLENLQSVELDRNEGPLAFIKDYKYFARDSDFEQLSTRGSYNGALDALRQGQAFRESYGHLYNESQDFPVFAASDQRVVDTARFFSRGFLGDTHTSQSALQIIPESRSQGANTLAPSTFCNGYNRQEYNSIINDYDRKYARSAINRLEELSPDFADHLSESYIYHMMSMCLFELNTVGRSPWCSLFTRDEWIGFQYQRDLTFYYQSSYGHPMSLGIGSNYVGAVLDLLRDDSMEESIFASFTHDTDITPVLVPLGLFDDGRDLPNDHIAFNSLFKSSQIVPMGARLVIERLRDEEDDQYVRIKVGDSVIPLSGCTSGPGFSCALDAFIDRVNDNLGNVTYIETCHPDEDLPQNLTFFWDWRTQDYN